MASSDSDGGSGVVHAASTATLDRSDESRLAVALVEYCALVDEGQPPGHSEFLARHGSIAGPLGECLAGLKLVNAAAGEFQPTSDGHPVAWADDHPTLLGEFRIIREIGRGGMGVVYEAEQQSLGRRVALKVLPASASLDPRQRQRFQVEAQAAALLHNEHIVPVFGSGFDRGTHYYAMQLIEGRPLTRFVRDLASEQTTVDHAGSSNRSRAYSHAHARETARLGLQAALALEHAHEIGVIHRDIKPSNLLIDARGQLWITDFGLARLPQEDLDLTRTGDLVGTIRYMSPEQVRAERGGVTSATDVYSLGVTLYELLTLRPAFDAPDRQRLLRRILEDEPVPPRRRDPSLPRDLETVILKAMEKEPTARYASAGALADDLRRFLDDQPIRARRPGLVDRTVKLTRRHRPAVLAGVAALIVTLAASTAILWEAKRRTDATLASYRQALSEERYSIELALGSLDQITRPLAAPAGSKLSREDEAKRALSWAVSFYDRLPQLVANQDMLKEVFPKAYRQAGFCRMILGRPRGRDDYRNAIRLYEKLVAEHPAQVWLRTGLIETLHEFSRLLKTPGDRAEAESSFRRALDIAAAMIDDPEVAKHCFTMGLVGPLNDLAWALARRPDVAPADAALALRLSRQVTEWEPSQAGFWNTLGVAYYRLGDDSSARAALRKSMDLNGGDPADWFFMAALEHRGGKKGQARKWFDRGVEWMEKNRGEDAEREAEFGKLREECSTILSE